MKVFADARTRCGSEVHPEIEAFWPIQLLKGSGHALGELHHFRQLLGFGAGDVVEMLEGCNHDVAGRIRKQIDDDEVVSSSKNDQPLRIVASIFTKAKDTRLRPLAAGR